MWQNICETDIKVVNKNYLQVALILSVCVQFKADGIKCTLINLLIKWKVFYPAFRIPMIYSAYEVSNS